MGLICLKNEVFKWFEPISFASLKINDFLFQIGFYGYEGIFKFFEFCYIQRAVRKARIDAANFGLNGGKLGVKPVRVYLLIPEAFGFPCLNLGKKLFFPFIWNQKQFHVSLHFTGEFFFPDKAAVVASQLFAFVRAPIIMVTLAGFLFEVAFSRDGKAAGTAYGKIEELKHFFILAFARLSNRLQRQLKVIEGLFGNHRDMYSLVHFTFMDEDAVVKWILNHFAKR